MHRIRSISRWSTVSTYWICPPYPDRPVRRRAIVGADILVSEDHTGVVVPSINRVEGEVAQKAGWMRCRDLGDGFHIVQHTARGLRLRDDDAAGIVMLVKRLGDVAGLHRLGPLVGQIDDLERTNTLSIKGTPHYLSPEAIQDPQGIDPTTDLYALGAVGYYLLAGRHVFDGKTIMEVCLHHLHTKPLPLSEVGASEVPEELEALIFACLEKDQSKRPKSGQELADALDRIDVASWTRADAEAWWDVFGEEVEQAKAPLPPASATEQTVAVDLEER